MPQADDTALFEPEQSVKTPGGRHLRPEIKERIIALHAQGYSNPKVSEKIPGVTTLKVKNVVANLKGNIKKTLIKRAKELTGNPNATANDYRLLSRQAKALGLTMEKLVEQKSSQP